MKRDALAVAPSLVPASATEGEPRERSRFPVNSFLCRRPRCMSPVGSSFAQHTQNIKTASSSLSTQSTCAFLLLFTNDARHPSPTVYPSLLRQSPTSIVVLRLDSTLRGSCNMIRMISPKSCPHRTYAFSWVLSLQAPRPIVVYSRKRGPCIPIRTSPALPRT